MKVVLIGDSIRMGYQPLVAEKLDGKMDVGGPAENCRHSQWALDHFQQWVGEDRPDVLHFNFGIHDSLPLADGEPQIVLEQYRLCLQRFIDRARELSGKLIWATTTPIFNRDDNKPMGQWEKNPQIDKYNAAALEIVRAEDLAVNDLHQVIMAGDYTKCISQDGVHMTPSGNKVLADAVAEALLSAC